MPDGDGNPLKPGDAVIYEHRDAGVSATVLALRPKSRYLIQLDPVQPHLPHEHPLLSAALDDEATLRSQAAANHADTQEPFVVPGSCLFLLEFGDGD
jgi:hypothetical protein